MSLRARAAAGLLAAALGGLLAATPSPLSADAATTSQSAQLKMLEHNVNQAFLFKYLTQHKEKVRAAPGNIRGIAARVVKATRNAFGHRTHLHLVDLPHVNAITTPGGNIFLYQGLIGAKLSDDELAALLGHEIAHMVHVHWFERLKRNLDAARMAQYGGKKYGRSSAQISQLLQTMQNLNYDRQEEFQADLTGMRLMVEAGYKPQGAVSLLKKVRALQTPEQSAAEKNPYLATHPGMDERIAKLQAVIDSGQAKPMPKKLAPIRR